MNQTNNQSKKEFSEERGNLKIVPAPDSSSSSGDSVVLRPDGLKVKKSGNLIIGKLNFIFQPIRDRHEKYYKNSKFHLLADLVLLLVIVALVGGIFWAKFFQAGPKMILSGELTSKEVVSGNLSDFAVAYANPNQEAMSELDLVLTMPAGFEITAAEPAQKFDGPSNSFHLGALAAGQSGDLKISALVLGSAGGQGSIFLDLKYKAGGKIYHALNTLDYRIAGSALSLAVSAPPEFYQGMETPIKLTAKNSGEKDLNDLAVRFADGWEIRSNGRVLSDKILPIGRLAAGEEKILELTVATARGAGEAALKPALFITAGKAELKLAEALAVVTVKQPKFQLAINSLKAAARHDETVEYELSYGNNEAAALSDLKMKFSSGNGNFRLASLELTGDGAKLGPDNVAALGRLAPGQTGAMRLKARFDRRAIAADQEINIIAEVAYQLAGRPISFRVASKKFKVISDLAVRAAAYYYSPQGDQLGVGPLPPTVDMPTSYWIFLQADNSGNRLKNFSLTAELPAAVYWTDRKSLLAGNLYHGEIGRRLVWSVDELAPDGTGKASFEIQIIPEAGDEGKVMDLLANLKYTAHDEFSGTDLSGSLPKITTELSADRLAKGLSRVVK